MYFGSMPNSNYVHAVLYFSKTLIYLQSDNHSLTPSAESKHHPCVLKSIEVEVTQSDIGYFIVCCDLGQVTLLEIALWVYGIDELVLIVRLIKALVD